ncbi:hypothetical protein HMPREF0494_1092 [Limosilactobacillus antri DSM 16041]|uniref:Uncharacterized protein n=1 Tax=Limosilactobacillus antri DSM 16041 TaxID=525309 RepID=C8P6Z8_9LACO|nr:hypothetical protein HMPREF0494_1092 [Limosilactobacillus antri DSM 16041]
MIGSSLKYANTLTSFFFTLIYLIIVGKRKTLTCLSITVIILK